jgi:EmrB/QacA subfamily drug resistance transporter
VPYDLSNRQIRLVFVGLMLGMFLAALDQTVVATALPTIVGDLGGLNHLSWVVTSYILASTVTVPLWGKLGDLYGRKGFFQIAIVIFLIGSALSGIAQDLGQLIGARAIQGLGGGGLLVGSQAIIGDVVPPRDRGRYTGLIGSAFAVASVAGPLIGGFFTDSLTWRWVFFINLPIGGLALIVVGAVLHGQWARVEHKIDYNGAAVLSLAVVALILMLTWGGVEYPWGSGVIIGLGVGALALFAILVKIERHAVEPIVPLHLFANSIFRTSFVCGGVVGFAMFGAMTFLPLFLQVVHGASPTSSGLQMAPIMAFVLVMSIYSGRRITTTGTYRRFPIAGMSLMLVSLLMFSQLTATTPYWQTLIYMAVMGTGLGMTMQVLLLVAQNSVEYRELGVATSLAAFGRSIGGSVGIAVFGTIFSNRLAHDLPEQTSKLPKVFTSNPAVKHALANLNGDSIAGSPAALKKLPGPLLHAIQVAFSDALHVVFLASIPVAVVGVIGTLLLKEVPLRRTYVPAEEGVVLSEGVELGESLGMPAPEEPVEAPARQAARSPARKPAAAATMAAAKKTSAPKRAAAAKNTAASKKAATTKGAPAKKTATAKQTAAPKQAAPAKKSAARAR